MRILFVIDNLHSGGAQRQMVTLGRGLRARGHEIAFFVYYPQHLHFASQLEESGIPIYKVHKRHRFSPAVVRALRHRLRIGNYQGVLSFLSTPNVYAEFAMLGMRKPFLVVSERAPLPDDASWTRRKLLRRLHQLADRVTVNTRHQHETLVAECPWLRGKVMTILNGLDLDTFRPSPSKPPDAEQDETIRLIAVGTMQPRKNMVTLIRALAEYRQKYSDLPFQVNWAGKKSLAEQQIGTFQQAEELISELNLRDHWHWLGEHAEVAPLLQQHDALIHPGLREGLSNAICEALACGRPVLAGRISDQPWLVEDGVRGFLFDAADPADIARPLRQYHQLPYQSKREMGMSARRFAEQELSLSRYVWAPP